MAKQNKTNSANTLRIIGGNWRGRKLNFPDIPGLRPTGDRIRETLFNWLQPVIGGSQCLDLYAGSGALGFEAASRGAAQVTMIEADKLAYQQLQQHQQTLSATQCDLRMGKAEAIIEQLSTPFHVVFIDPPFQAALWSTIAKAITEKGLLHKNAMIYLECPRQSELPALPDSWQLIKQKQAGEVNYCLFQYQTGGQP